MLEACTLMPTSPHSPRGLSPVERLDRAARVRFRHRLLLTLTPIALGLFAGVLYTLHLPRLYQASGTLQVLPNAVEGGSPQVRLPSWFRPIAHDLANDSELMTSPTFLREVAQRLPREVQADLLDESPDDLTPSARASSIAATLGEQLLVEQDLHDKLFTVTCFDTNPRTAAAVVNQVLQSFFLFNQELAEARSNRLDAFLAGQLHMLRQQIAAAQARENAIEHGPDLSLREAQRQAAAVYQFEFGSIDDDPMLPPLLSAAREARLTQGLAWTRYRFLEAVALDPRMLDDSPPALIELRQALANAEQSYATLAAELGPRHPELTSRTTEMRTLREQISHSERAADYNTKAEGRMTALQGNILNEAIQSRRGHLAHIAELEAGQAAFELELALNLSVYEDLRARMQAQRVRSGLEVPTIQTIDTAPIPLLPLPRDFTYPLLFGGGFGLVLAILGRTLHAVRSARSWTVQEIEASTGLPALAILAQHADPHTLPGSEELRALEQEVKLLPADLQARRLPGCTVLVFTSATPAEGKTTCASTFAATLAQRGAQTLLIDADLHRPAVHHFFGLSGRRGLSSVLSGHATLEDVLERVPAYSNLHVLGAGPVPPAPAMLLASQRLAGLLAHAAASYRYIVVDSPPLLALTDAVSLSSQCDLVMLVARYSRVTLDQLTRAQQLLHRAGVRTAGILVNGAPPA